MKKIAFLAVCTLLAGPALAQSVGEKTGINSVLGISPTTPDFVKQAAISDMFEIESSKLAAQKAPDGPVKNFANQMVTEHTKTSTELKSAVANDPKSPIPTTMDDAHRDMITKLSGLNGAEFTEEYVDMQVDAHQNAVSLFERYAKGGDSESLKAWAGKTLPSLQHHLEMAKALDK
jgi:putative membrane protein